MSLSKGHDGGTEKEGGGDWRMECQRCDDSLTTYDWAAAMEAACGHLGFAHGRGK